jgi:hypothetical protein
LAYILTASAAADTIAAAEGDPLAEWIAREGLRPLVTPVTMAQVLHGIETNPNLSGKERLIYRRLADEAMRDLEDRTEALLANATFGFQEARVLAEIMDISAADIFGEFDLIPAAIAVRRGHDLVIVENLDAWSAFASSISRAIGKLRLKAF